MCEKWSRRTEESKLLHRGAQLEEAIVAVILGILRNVYLFAMWLSSNPVWGKKSVYRFLSIFYMFSDVLFLGNT